MRIISLVNMSRNHISYVFYLHGKLVIKGRLPAAISAHQVWFTDYVKTGSLLHVGS